MLNALTYESNLTYTENGAITNKSTMSDCLDFFATVGALRRESDGEIIYVPYFKPADSAQPDGKNDLTVVYFIHRSEK